MIFVKTPIDSNIGVDLKNQWLCQQGLVHDLDWWWNFCDGHTKHLHGFNDEHEQIAALFVLTWS